MWLASETHLWLVGWSREQQGSCVRSFGPGISKGMGSIWNLKVGKDIRDWRGKEEQGNAVHRAWWCIEWGGGTWPGGVRGGAGPESRSSLGEGRFAPCVLADVGMRWGVTGRRVGRRHGRRVCWSQCCGGRARPWVWLGRRPGSSCWKAGLFIPQFRCIMEKCCYWEHTALMSGVP